MDADVIIVGAGPAGSTAAKILAENNISVLILEKKEFPRKKVCAAGLMAHTFEDFPYVKPFINCYNYKLRVVSPNLETEFSLEDDNPIMAMTHGRDHFDNELLNLAIKAGAKVRQKCKVTGVKIEKSKGSVIFQNENNEKEIVYGNIVIGADSAVSIVGKSLNIGCNNDPKNLGIAIEKEFTLSEDICNSYFGKNRCVSLYLHFGGAFGYGWIFPRKSSLNIGIGGELQSGNKLKSQFLKFISFLKTHSVIPPDLIGEKYTAAILPVVKPYTNIVWSRALLVGDAGGFCSAATGEGIYYAMVSGSLAAEVCLKSLNENNFSIENMGYFNTLWQKKIGQELNFQSIIQKKVLNDERRCRKAVNWATQDKKLKAIFGRFLTGSQDYRGLPLKMLYHYIHNKIREKLGKIKKPQSDIEFEAKLKKK
jgi:geranylgeranyl reductase family protein